MSELQEKEIMNKKSNSPNETTLTVNFGPQHPSMHGVCRLVIDLDGEKIINVTPRLGYLHRSIEKICEFRSYSQVIPFLDRCDYITGLSTELAYVLAVEKLMGIEPPDRANYIRTILVELTRIASHIFFYATYGMDLGAYTPTMYGWREREKILDLLESVTGYRLTPNYMRIGGVKLDLPDGFLNQTMDFLKELPGFLSEYDDLLTGNEIFQMRTQGVARIDPKWAINMGVTGPLLRATGLKWDLRKDDPYLIYDRFDFDVPVGKQGDCFDAYEVRMMEIRESVKIIKQAVEAIPDGSIKIPMPAVIKPPKGSSYVRIESPRGELGIFVQSDGSERPYRFKLRPPSLMNIQAVPDLLKGVDIADAIAIFGVVDPVMGEVDR